ncbi:MAG: LysM peptidoglycan-binding domain-containing protein [Bacteroidetes bacterium]|nr:LysM peptidoglycan-binding domain-containing protein [Bacteroidota bacterium]
MKNTLLLVVLLLLSLFALGQTTRKEVIDTVYSGNSPVLLYSDFSWAYVQVDSLDLFSLPEYDDMEPGDTTNVLGHHWINDQVFAFFGEKNKIGNDTVIRVINSESIFTMPIRGKLYRGFTYYHKGLDISLSKGDPVFAAFDGVVRYARYNRGGFGYLVIIRHFNGLETYYAHLSKLKVIPNQYVRSGDLIGLGGSTGRSRSPHLHFEIRYKDLPFDPLKVIDYDNQRLYAETLTIGKSLFNIQDDIAGAKYHRIRSGETLSTIARKYGTSVRMLCALNKIKTTTILRIGRTLRVR